MGPRHPIVTLFFAAVLTAWITPATADVLKIGGTGGAIGLLRHLGKPFAERTGHVLEVVPSLGSGGGIKAVGDGAIDLSITGRTLSETDQARGLTTAFTLRTPYVFATSKAGSVAMTAMEIVAAYANAKPTWPDGTGIKVILRPRAEDDNAVIAGLLPGMANAMASARERTELPIATTDQDNADLAETIAGSLIGATYTQITMEQRNLRLITVDGVAPSLDAVESGQYRYTKMFNIVSPRQASRAAAQFLQFLKTEDGVRLLREGGCLPGGGE